MTGEAACQATTSRSSRLSTREDLCFDLRLALRSEAPTLVSGERHAGRLIARLLHERGPHGDVGSPFVVVDHNVLSDYATRLSTVTPVSSNRSEDPSEMKARWTLFVEDVDRLTCADQDLLICLLDAVYAADATGAADCGGQMGRVISATGRNLTECAARGTFRWDLLYRLNVIHLVVPPDDADQLAIQVVDRLLDAMSEGTPVGSSRRPTTWRPDSLRI